MKSLILIILSVLFAGRVFSETTINGQGAGGTATSAAITSGTVSGVTESGILPNRPYVQGTNVTIDFPQPETLWNTTNAVASRFAFSHFPTSSNSAPECHIVIVANPGSVWTNVADTFQPDGPWGSIISPTTHLNFYWIGTAMHMIQDPTSWVIRPAQLVANTDNWNPTGFDTSEVIEFSTDASRNITGFVGVTDGRSRVFHNNGTQNAVFKNSVTSTATNQLKLSADITLAGAQSLAFRYDLTAQRWFAIGGIGGASPTTFVGFSDTSAHLATALTDETGTGLAVFGTSPTITTPTISGAIGFPAGTRQTFSPNATTPGFNVGSVSGDPASPSDGDIWNDSSGNLLRARINGATVSLGAGGGSTPTTTRGDLIVRGASADQRLALGTVWQVPRSDATDVVWGDSGIFGAMYAHRAWWWTSSGGGTINTSGNIVSLSGTGSNVAPSSTEPSYVNCLSGATSGNISGALDNQLVMHSARKIRFHAMLRTTETNAVRYWVGLSTLSGGSTGAADSPAGSLCAFRYSDGGGDTTWRCVTKDGTTLNSVDSGVAPSTSTPVRLSVEWDPAGSAKFYINRVLKATLVANLPASAAIYFHAQVTTTENVAKNIKFAWAYAEETFP